MLQTVKDACKFDPKAIDYALSDQIENLDDLIGHDPKSAKAFFSKTYVTGGMKTLLRQGFQRLSGTSGQAVFELKQAMGGGKTHSMLALGYLAANPKLFGLVAKDITQGIKAEPAQVVAIFATMDDQLIKDLKVAAIDEDKSASVCLEMATREWLERRVPKARKS